MHACMHAPNEFYASVASRALAFDFYYVLQFGQHRYPVLWPSSPSPLFLYPVPSPTTHLFLMSSTIRTVLFMAPMMTQLPTLLGTLYSVCVYVLILCVCAVCVNCVCMCVFVNCVDVCNPCTHVCIW